MNDLGLMEDYGNIILSVWLVVYGCLYTYLDYSFGSIE